MIPEILYEDNHLLVVNKPAGLLTQPSGTEQDSLESHCKQWIKTKYNKPGQVFLHAIHRLDKQVSGIVVFARTTKSLTRLNAAMRQKSYKKCYLALVEKAPNAPEGILEHYLTHDDYQANVVAKGHPGAKLSRLQYRILKEFGNYIVLEIELDTGRYHQIRAQLGAIGCPIVGDTKYGSTHPLPQRRIALHHARLELDHPVTQVHLLFEAPWNFSKELTKV